MVREFSYTAEESTSGLVVSWGSSGDCRGVDSLLNVSDHPDPEREDFASMRNDSVRALRALQSWPNTFDTAETLLIVAAMGAC